MTALVVGLVWCAVIGFLATASRMTWSFARDKGLPFHRFIRKVRAPPNLANLTPQIETRCQREWQSDMARS